MKKAKIGIISLGHYIYFEQFEGLREELLKKSEELKGYLDTEKCQIVDAGYIDCVEQSFEAAKFLRREDPDLIFVILSTYVPSSVAAPLARYLDTPQVLVAVQPLNHLDYAHTTTYLQLANDDVCAMPEIAGVYERLGRNIPPCIVASASMSDFLAHEIGEWTDAACALAAFKYETIGYLGHTYEGMYDMHTDPTAFTRTFGSHVKMLEMCELADLSDAVSDGQIKEKISEITKIFNICDHIFPVEAVQSSTESFLLCHGIASLKPRV